MGYKTPAQALASQKFARKIMLYGTAAFAIFAMASGGKDHKQSGTITPVTPTTTIAAPVGNGIGGGGKPAPKQNTPKSVDGHPMPPAIDANGNHCRYEKGIAPGVEFHWVPTDDSDSGCETIYPSETHSLRAVGASYVSQPSTLPALAI